MDKSEGTAICRDYLRKMCSRGDTCKYKHPEKRYMFCSDYQRGRCVREDCLFVHCSREDERHYNESGQLPPHLSHMPQLVLPTVCKDFLRGECARLNCRFRHPASNGQERFDNGRGVAYGKRWRGENDNGWSLEDENEELRRTVAELKKQVGDLQATNEFLLEQNAQMRIKSKVPTGLVTVPAVTLTSAAQIQPRAVTAGVPVSIAAVAATPVSIATVSMAPVQIPASSVAMSQQPDTPPTQALVSYPIVARSITTIGHSPLTH